MYILGWIRIQQDNWTSEGGEYKYDEKEFESYENKQQAKTTIKLTKLATISKDAGSILGFFYTSLIRTIKKTGPLGSHPPITQLINCDDEYVDVVQFMVSVVEAMRSKLQSDIIKSYLKWPDTFLKHMYTDPQVKANIAISGNAIVRLYIDFLKCIAWSASNFIWEKKTTFNETFLRGLIRNMGALPGVELSESLMDKIYIAVHLAPAPIPMETTAISNYTPVSAMVRSPIVQPPIVRPPIVNIVRPPTVRSPVSLMPSTSWTPLYPSLHHASLEESFASNLQIKNDEYEYEYDDDLFDYNTK
jgi:hypothetical protein